MTKHRHTSSLASQAKHAPSLWLLSVCQAFGDTSKKTVFTLLSSWSGGGTDEDGEQGTDKLTGNIVQLTKSVVRG